MMTTIDRVRIKIPSCSIASGAIFGLLRFSIMESTGIVNGSGFYVF